MKPWMTRGQAGATAAVVLVIAQFEIPLPSLVDTVADRWGLTAGLGLYAAVPVVMLLLLLPAPRTTPMRSTPRLATISASSVVVIP